MTASTKLASTKSSGSSDFDVESGVGKTMGVWAAMSLIVGCIIGTGVFSNGGKILVLVGSPGMAMCMWLFGGLIAYCGGFSYTEWGLMIPESGGDAPYLEYVYRKPKLFFSFLYCWCRVLLIHTGYTAALSTVVGIYALYAFPLSKEMKVYEEWITKGIAVITMSIIFAICAFSNRIATKTTTAITFVKVLIVVFVVVSGVILAAGGFPNVKRPENKMGIFEGTSTSPSDYSSALFKVAFAYDGWSMLATSCGELQDPVRNIPKAIIGGVTVVTALYLGANLSYFMALSVEEIKNTKEVLAADFAARLYGEFFGRKIMALLILVSAFGATLAITFAASRVAQAAAQRRFMPMADKLSQTHPKYKTPFAALVFHYVMTVLLAVVPPGSNTFFFLVDATGYPVWVLYTVTLVGLIVLRFREPNKERLFKVWIICPIIVILTGIFASVFPFFAEKETMQPALVGLACIVLGFPAYYFIVYRNMNKNL